MLNLELLSFLKQRKDKCILALEDHPAKHQEMEDLYRGSVQDIKEGCMIAVLAIDDACDYPLWITKVMKVNKENEELVSVEVHWYAINTHPFDGVYKGRDGG